MSKVACRRDDCAMLGGYRTRTSQVKASKFRLVVLSGLGLTAGFLITPAFAGCNSGSVAATSMLTSSGCQGSAPAENATAVGASANAGGYISTAIGGGAQANGWAGTAVGYKSGANQDGAAAFGKYAEAGLSSTSIGNESLARANYTTAVGYSSGHYETDNTGAVSIGALSEAYAVGSIALGGYVDSTLKAAKALGFYSIAIGTASIASGREVTAVGYLSGNGSATTNSFNSAFGGEAGSFVTGVGNTGIGLAAGYTVNGDLNTALGNSAGQAVTGGYNMAAGVLAGSTVAGDANVAVGYNAGRDVTGSYNIAVGLNAGRGVSAGSTISVGTDACGCSDLGVAIGYGAHTSARASVALGYLSVADAADTVSVGTKKTRRRIVNAAPAVNPNDVTTLSQVKKLISAATKNGSETAQLDLDPAAASSDEVTVAGAVEGSSPDSSEARSDQQQSSGVDEPAEEEAPGMIVAWANVRPNGTAAGRNLAANKRAGVGSYEISFKRKSMGACTFNATLSTPGFITINPGQLANSIKVETRNRNGAATDTAFYLMAVC